MRNQDDLASKARALGGLPVWGTVTGSAADRAGLRSGDIVLRINGVASLALDDGPAAGPLGGVELQVLRDDALLALSLPVDVDACVFDELQQQLLGRRERSRMRQAWS